MRGRKTIPVPATIAVGGALVLGGCGGSDSTTGTSNASAPAHAAMKGHREAMHGDKAAKDRHGDAMNQHHEAMHEG